MQKRINLNVRPEIYNNSEELIRLISQKTSIDLKYLSYRIEKESLDARKAPIYHLDIIASNNNDLPSIAPDPFLNVSNSMPVIVVGAGPCGLMAALRLLQKGLKPIIIERGSKIEKRKQDVASLLRNGVVDEDSNFCFGEGGAGTFSDGKLYTRSNKRGNIREVLQFFVHFGASEEILYKSNPHIGTDALSRVIKNIRQTILDHGGEIMFDTKVVNLIVKDEQVIGVTTALGENIMAKKVILATGHSAKNIYKLFYDNNWSIESKPFAVGVRVEHPQELINSIQYHRLADYSILPPARYTLSCQNGERGIFSFCMCPGGMVIPTVDKAGIMVVNGMSNSSHSGKFANSAIVVTINQEDAKEFSGYGALSLLKAQEKWEQMMYYDRCICPAQRLSDFMTNKISSNLASSSYVPGLVSADMKERLPKTVVDNLKVGFKEFDKKMKGFITSQANIIGLESRTSSPVRIIRDKTNMQHIQIKNLYPAGEGAGYAGGITSSCLDGINIANQIAEELGI